MSLNITAFSTALFATWINVEELNLLIDAGDGLTSGLLQKARKIKHAFITHPDRDHLTGLHQFVQLNTREEFPKIYYPKDSGSFPAMQSFLSKFDPHILDTEWNPIQHDTKVSIKKGCYVHAIRNEHIPAADGVFKSLSYKVFETKQKLKAEFKSLENNRIQELIKTKGKDALTETVERNIISFSGDTPVDDYDKWNNSEILMHEATFIREDPTINSKARGKHSRLDEVLKMASEINGGNTKNVQRV